ncbi:hypothetical protein [Spongiactinospora rosea]|nr:hypothetical protein [Spongiactinospora rosea]
MADLGMSGEWHTNGQYAGQCNDECPGGTWCDCQHRPPRLVLVAQGAPAAPTAEQIAAGTGIAEHLAFIEAS